MTGRELFSGRKEVSPVRYHYDDSLTRGNQWPRVITKSETNALSKGEDDFGAKSALTWCPGQWHPTAIQHRHWGATDLSFLMSVHDPANYSLFERDLA